MCASLGGDDRAKQMRGEEKKQPAETYKESEMESEENACVREVSRI